MLLFTSCMRYCFSTASKMSPASEVLSHICCGHIILKIFKIKHYFYWAVPAQCCSHVEPRLYMQMSEDSLIVLGVDGGATKTACAAVLLSTQQHLNQASAGPSNWYALTSRPVELPCNKFAFHADLTVCWSCQRCNVIDSISVC